MARAEVHREHWPATRSEPFRKIRCWLTGRSELNPATSVADLGGLCRAKLIDKSHWRVDESESVPAAVAGGSIPHGLVKPGSPKRGIWVTRRSSMILLTGLTA